VVGASVEFTRPPGPYRSARMAANELAGTLTAYFREIGLIRLLNSVAGGSGISRVIFAGCVVCACANPQINSTRIAHPDRMMRDYPTHHLHSQLWTDHARRFPIRPMQLDRPIA